MTQISCPPLMNTHLCGISGTSQRLHDDETVFIHCYFRGIVILKWSLLLYHYMVLYPEWSFLSYFELHLYRKDLCKYPKDPSCPKLPQLVWKDIMYKNYECKLRHHKLTLAALNLICPCCTGHSTWKVSLSASWPCSTCCRACVPWSPNCPCSLNYIQRQMCGLNWLV